MRIKPLVVSIVLALAAIMATTTMTGCSQAQTLERAGDFRQIADKSASAAEKIQNALEKYNAGIIEESVFVDMILAWLPENRRVLFESWLEIGTEVRVAAEDMVVALRNTAAESYKQESALIAKAASNQNKWDNFVSIVGSVASVLLQPEGAVMLGLGGLAALFRKREKSALATATASNHRAREATDTAMRIKGVAENLVQSFEVFKATDSGGAAYRGGAKVPFIASQTPETSRFVDRVKSEMVPKGRLVDSEEVK